jgi:DNA-binding transcriptional ArsR family regulator
MVVHPYSLGPEADIAPVASLMADATRATMLTALLDDRPLAAGELARLAGVSPATASAHLARLRQGRLITVLTQGRHRYYRLAGPEVAAALEALSHISPPAPVRSLRASRQEAALAAARTCYDHLAGRAGVSLLDALRARRIVVPGDERPTLLDVTEEGEATLASFGINMKLLRKSRRRLAGECLDWTERRYHLNGALGAAITARLLDLGWIERGARRRAVKITAEGEQGLSQTFGWRPETGARSDAASTGSRVRGA